ncbi:hypothetical protein B4135_3992 [Caldibacillus debilis]|uniref:Uncharacterized protein n=1 Tax=Caldibacillus debilis TaxID=301148 RepID=A0A150L9S4_9BACI|nr:hypothetical protein B4135_3992 [Caldibacillus debilis]
MGRFQFASDFFQKRFVCALTDSSKNHRNAPKRADTVTAREKTPFVRL